MKASHSRISLCTLPTQIGCRLVVAIVLGSLSLIVSAKNDLAILGIFSVIIGLPHAPLIWMLVSQFLRTIGKGLEIRSDGLALYEKDQLIWDFQWKDIEKA